MSRRAALAATLAAAVSLSALAYDPLAPAAAPKTALALALAVVTSALTLASPRRAAPIALPRAAAAFFALVAWRALSLAWGAPAEASTLGAELAAVALALHTLTLPREEAEAVATHAGAAVGGLAGLWSLLDFAAGGRGFALHGGQGNPDWLGLLLAMTLPFGLAAAASARRASRPRFALLALFVLLQLAGLLLGHSRVAWLGAPAALALGAVAAAPAARRRRVLLLAAGGGLVALALGAAALRGDWAVSATFSDDTRLGGAAEARLWIAARTLDVAWESLPFGAGLGGFHAAYLDAQGHALATLSPDAAARTFVNATTAHQDLLEVLAVGGPLGALLFVLTLGLGAHAGLTRGAPAAGSCLVAFGLVGLGDSPLSSPACVLLLALALAALPRDLTLRGPATTGLRVTVFAASAWLLRGAGADWLAMRRLTEARDTLPAERLHLLEEAARLAPKNGEVSLALGLAHLEAGRPEAALRELGRSRERLANLGTDVALGNAHFARGDLDAARRAFGRALARHPGSLRARTNLALVELAAGDLDAAERHLAVARGLSPGAAKVVAAEEALRRARLERAVGAPEGQ